MGKFLTVILFVLFMTTLNAQEQKPNHFQILLGYENDVYSKPYYRNFNLAHMGFGYKGNLTTFYGTLNLGYLYEDISEAPIVSINNQKQIEFDYYQCLSKSKSTSFWLNYAYSQDKIYPQHRITFELWQKLPVNFLISGGGCHYIFDNSNATILNVGLENYFNRYWLEFKTYFFLKQPNITYSYSLTGRVFFKDVNYLQLGINIGSAQDEPFILISDINRLTAKTANIRYVTDIAKQRVRLNIGFTYLYENYQSNLWRNRYAGGIGIIYNITN